jgi:arylsulfatase A-like enzyme
MTSFPRSAALCFLCLACSEAFGGSDDDPDVVVIVIDTLRADRLPFYGHPGNTAPFLTEFAAANTIFDRAVSTSSWTAPATASLFTSVYPSQHQVTVGLHLYEALRDGESPDIVLNRIPEELETLPVFLRDRGYRTFGVADNPNVQQRGGFGRGFDRFRSLDYEGGASVNEVVEVWRDAILGPGKYFLYLHYMDPHHPYHRREPWYTAPESDDAQALALAAYDSEIGYVDQRIREVFEGLGLDEETVVVITSDHGEELLQRGKMHHEFRLYEELIHVPLLVRHPGARLVGQRVAQEVSLLDVLPTLREIVDAPVSNQDEGESLVPYLMGEERTGERALFAMRSLELPVRGVDVEIRAVVHGDDKLISIGKDDRQVHELYDLSSDPGETLNLAEKDNERVDELLELWSEFDATAPRWTPDAVPLTLTPAQARELERIGYVSSDE